MQQSNLGKFHKSKYINYKLLLLLSKAEAKTRYARVSCERIVNTQTLDSRQSSTTTYDDDELYTAASDLHYALSLQQQRRRYRFKRGNQQKHYLLITHTYTHHTRTNRMTHLATTLRTESRV